MDANACIYRQTAFLDVCIQGTLVLVCQCEILSLETSASRYKIRRGSEKKERKKGRRNNESTLWKTNRDRFVNVDFPCRLRVTTQ